MEKACIFYASKNHLSMILLNMLNNKDVKKYTVITFLEESIKNEIDILKNKYNIKINSKNKIEFTKTKRVEDRKLNTLDNSIIIIEGKNNYIKEVNDYLEKNISDSNKNIKIINCYDYNSKKEIINTIIKENNKMFSTTGEKHLTNLV